VRYLFIANPIAGKGRTKKILPKIESFLIKNKVDYKLLVTNSADDIKFFAENYGENFDRIVVIGGDGTIHNLINAYATKSKIVGVLPTGSGNDFAYTLGLKKSLYDDLKTLINEETHTLDIGYTVISNFDGSTSSKFFVNSLGIGFDAEVAHVASKTKYIKGIILYLISVFRVLVNYNYRRINLKSQELSHEDEFLMISIGNGKTAGGGFKLTPFAEPNDGLLDVCVVKKVSKMKLLQILPLAIIGKHVKRNEVMYFQTKNLEITSEKPLYIHADGEILSTNMKSIKIHVLKQYARFLTDGLAYVNEKT